METYIALLRGINVGGHKKVPMAELRELLEKSGYNSVSTYIQSGNVKLNTAETHISKVEQHLSKLITQHFGFEVIILVKTYNQLKAIVEACPFPKGIQERSYYTILQEPPKPERVKLLEQEHYTHEMFHITNQCVYFYAENGYARAKCNTNFFERKLNVNATARNHKTMLKLLSLCQDNS